METETIKSKRRLSQSMGDLYLLESIAETLESPLAKRGYVMTIPHEGNLYSYSFAQCDEPHEVGKIDEIITKNFKNCGFIPILFDIDDSRQENSQKLEDYLNLNFGNKPQILKTETGITLLQRTACGNLVGIESSLIYLLENIPKCVTKLILLGKIFGFDPLEEFLAKKDNQIHKAK